MSDYKQIAARAAAEFIRPGNTVGFGAGSSMLHLIDWLKDNPDLSRSLTTVSSSFVTRQRLLDEGFALVRSEWITRVDLYFDGCDQFDHRLNALKSGGGIHTSEKILAAMADQFILVGDITKRVSRLDGTFPLVIEVVPEALAFIIHRLKKYFNPARADLRAGDKKDGPVITERGNYLVDCWFDPFPEPAMLNERIRGIPGILEHSLFYNMAHRAITAGPEGIQIFGRT
jgi:ribose 5-phosphate isomerase A